MPSSERDPMFLSSKPNTPATSPAASPVSSPTATSEIKESPTSRALYLVRLFACHATCSVSMVLLNKRIAVGFPYFWTVLLVQNVGTVLLGSCGSCWDDRFRSASDRDGETRRAGSSGAGSGGGAAGVSNEDRTRTNGDHHASGGQHRNDRTASSLGEGNEPLETSLKTPMFFCGVRVPKIRKNRYWVVTQSVFFLATLYLSIASLYFVSVPLFVVARNTVPAATAAVEVVWTRVLQTAGAGKFKVGSVAILGLLLTIVGATTYVSVDLFSSSGSSSTSPRGPDAAPIALGGAVFLCLYILVIAVCSVVDKTSVRILGADEGITPVQCNQMRVALSIPATVFMVFALDMDWISALRERSEGGADPAHTSGGDSSGGSSGGNGGGTAAFLSAFSAMEWPVVICLVCSTVFGFGMGTINLYLQKAVAAASVQVANIVYKLLTTVVGLLLFPASVSLLQWFGYSLSLLGVGLYTFGGEKGLQEFLSSGGTGTTAGRGRLFFVFLMGFVLSMLREPILIGVEDGGLVVPLVYGVGRGGNSASGVGVFPDSGVGAKEVSLNGGAAGHGSRFGPAAKASGNAEPSPGRERTAEDTLSRGPARPTVVSNGGQLSAAAKDPSLGDPPPSRRNSTVFPPKAACPKLELHALLKKLREQYSSARGPSSTVPNYRSWVIPTTAKPDPVELLRQIAAAEYGPDFAKTRLAHRPCRFLCLRHPYGENFNRVIGLAGALLWMRRQEPNSRATTIVALSEDYSTWFREWFDESAVFPFDEPLVNRSAAESPAEDKSPEDRYLLDFDSPSGRALLQFAGADCLNPPSLDAQFMFEFLMRRRKFAEADFLQFAPRREIVARAREVMQGYLDRVDASSGGAGGGTTEPVRTTHVLVTVHKRWLEGVCDQVLLSDYGFCPAGAPREAQLQPNVCHYTAESVKEDLLQKGVERMVLVRRGENSRGLSEDTTFGRAGVLHWSSSTGGGLRTTSTTTGRRVSSLTSTSQVRLEPIGGKLHYTVILLSDGQLEAEDRTFERDGDSATDAAGRSVTFRFVRDRSDFKTQSLMGVYSDLHYASPVSTVDLVVGQWRAGLTRRRVEGASSAGWTSEVGGLGRNGTWVRRESRPKECFSELEYKLPEG